MVEWLWGRVATFKRRKEILSKVNAINVDSAVNGWLDECQRIITDHKQ